MKFLWTQFVCLTLSLTILVGSVGMADIILVSGMVKAKASKEIKDGCCSNKKESTVTEKPTLKKILRTIGIAF